MKFKSRLVLIQVWKAVLLPQSCCQQENLAPVLSGDLFFSQTLINSSLILEHLPWLENCWPAGGVWFLPAGEMPVLALSAEGCRQHSWPCSLHPQCWDVDFTDFYIPLNNPDSSKKAKAAQSFQWPQNEKVCWSHIWGDKRTPISCLWGAAFSQADYIWIFSQN